MTRSLSFKKRNRCENWGEITLMFLCLFAFIFVLFGAIGVHAQEPSSRLFVAPAKFELAVSPGEAVTSSIRIINRSRDSVPIEAVSLNFTAEELTGSMRFFGGVEPRGTERGTTRNKNGEEAVDDTSFNTSKWIVLEKPNFILSPGEEERIPFSIRVPENAEPGGHYAVILFQPRVPPSDGEGTGPRIIPQIGSLVLLSVMTEDMERPARTFAISTFALPEDERMRTVERMFTTIFPPARAETLQIVGKSLFRFSLGIKNNDIIHVRPEGKITLYDFRGKKVNEIDVLPQTVLPGKTREFSIPFDSVASREAGVLPPLISRWLTIGNYSAAVQLRSPEGFTVSDVFTFWIFPWKALSISFLFGTALFIMRKRFFGAVKVLVPGIPMRMLRREKKK